jgi:hypothetical protein
MRPLSGFRTGAQALPVQSHGFLADKMSSSQGYLTSEPYAVQNEGGFTPDVFLMADAGYTTYSTMIVGMSDYVKANPDVTKRFVEASIVGWYNYLYGDNKAANDLIKSQNPDMTDGQIEFTIGKMKEYGLLESGEALEKGIGCMTDARRRILQEDGGCRRRQGGLDLSMPTPPNMSARASGWSSRRADPAHSRAAPLPPAAPGLRQGIDLACLQPL